MKTGKTLLFVSGILIIIDAILSTVGLVMAISGLIAAGATSGSAEAAAVVSFVAVLSLIAAGIGIVFDVFAGYYGIQAYRKGDAKTLNRAYVFGIIILVLTALSVLGMFGGTASVYSWISSIYGLVVSILYIVGAFMVKNAMKDNSNK